MSDDQSTATGHEAPALADAGFLRDLRTQMLKFATLQLGDASRAEDAVQEALIGALKNAGSFAGRAALRTWVFAILKHKIADSLRGRAKEKAREAPETDESELNGHLFDARGFWQRSERPQQWADPEGAFQQSEFWTVFQVCLEHLPAQQARVFMMREFIELETTEICSSLELSVSNLHVTLHRARLRLRECLEDRWFVRGD